MRNFSVSLLAFFCCFTSAGQNWQRYFDSAARYYGHDPQKTIQFYILAAEGLAIDSPRTDSYYGCLSYIGILYSESGDYKKAEDFHLEARDVVLSMHGKYHPDYATTCRNLAMLYKKMMKLEAAESLLLETKLASEKSVGKLDSTYTKTCNSLAGLYMDLGRFEDAEPLYLEVISLTEQALGKQHLSYAYSCNNLGLLYYRLGQYVKAQRLYFEAQEIIGRQLGKKSLAYATCLNNLGLLYHTLGLLETAESMFLESKDIHARHLNSDPASYANACDNLASLYITWRQYEKAERLSLEATDIRKKTRGEHHPDYISSCLTLANLYENMGVYQKAESFYVEGKSLTVKIWGKQHPMYSRFCNALANLYWITNQVEKANVQYAEGFNQEYINCKRVLEFISEKEKEEYLSGIGSTNPHLYSYYFSIRNAALLYEISFLNRNLILSSSQQLKKTISFSKDSSVINDYKTWVGYKSELAILYSRGARGPNVEELEEKANSLEKALSRSSPNFKAGQRRSWKDIQQHLKPNEAAIEFLEFNYHTGKRWTDSNYYVAVVLRKDKGPVLVDLFEKKQLDSILIRSGNKSTHDNVKALYSVRGLNSERKPAGSQGSVYELVWKPIEKELENIQTIYFAPAGMLHRIAFAALPVGDNKVLSDKYRLEQLNTTESIINKQPVYLSGKDGITIYGGIQYDADSQELRNAAFSYAKSFSHRTSVPHDLQRGGGWSELPGTKVEVNAIQSIARKQTNPVKVLSGVSANEESIKALDGDPSPAVIHIATHGFFFPPSNLKENNNVTLPADGRNVFVRSESPLFRSGLLLAGANNTWAGKQIEGIEDGILTAYEVSNLYLPNIKLVVLSACETGLGDIQGGEGVYGLHRAFKMAGVDYMIMSLWKVPDQETPEFMQELYKGLFDNLSIADAFYQAQSYMKKRYRNEPLKWAAWVLIR